MIGSTDDPSPDSTPWSRRSVTALDEQRREAIARAEAAFGPLSVQADPAHDAVGAAQLVSRFMHGRRITAVLQVLVDPAGFLADGTSSPGLTVTRRLTYTRGNGTVVEHISAACLPNLHPHNLDVSDPGYWQRSAKLASALLPTELADVLLDNPYEAPPRLLIVATGASQVAFDGLPLTSRPTPVLAQVAATVRLGSLATAAYFADATPHPTNGTVSIYDTVQLSHTKAELSELREHQRPVQNVASRAQLEELLAGDPAQLPTLLAMGVHGTADEEGWGQLKLLPDGSILSTADVLNWTVPQLCVLASCHSALRERDDGNQAGFPIAMMLRGAHTVIGTLLAVPDAATSEVMQRFWRELAAKNSPVDALFLARAAWLTDEPERLRDRRAWAGLLAYGKL